MAVASNSESVLRDTRPARAQALAPGDEISRAIGLPMSRLLARLGRLPVEWAILLAVLLTCAVGWLDYFTGFDTRVDGLYLVPICWVSWVAGRRPGMLLAVMNAVAVGLADILSRTTPLHPMIPVWNALMMLVLFLATVLAQTAFLRAYRELACAQTLLREFNRDLEQTVQQRTAALRAEITERQRVEQEKLKAEQLLERQEKLATLGTLTAGIAHEIRNPLTSIKARLYTLEKHLHAVPAARKDADLITSEISRLERIVQDALSFARPADPKFERISVDRLLREIHGLMAGSLESRSIQLVLQSDSLLFVRGDSGHLKQVLINLIRNAADAIDTTGTIRLRARADRALLGGEQTDVAVLDVCDSGKGIPPEIEKRLFDPFFTTKERGTGLGLAIAARMVEKHGGRIQYQTSAGHGTTFSVVLPRETENPPGRAKHDADGAS